MKNNDYEKGVRRGMLSAKRVISEMIETAVREMLVENSRSQKLVRAITKGYAGHIKNFGIVSPENPMGMEAEREYNNAKVRDMKATLKGGRQGFQRELKTGNYNYLRVKGMYNSPERSYLIYNCTRQDIERFADEYKQQAYVWAEIRDGKVHSEMWSREDEADDFTLEVSRDYVIDAASDTDFFSEIAKKLKFRLPFYDEETKEEWEKNQRATSDEEEELLIKSIDPKRTGHSRYAARSKFNKSYYGKRNINI